MIELLLTLLLLSMTGFGTLALFILKDTRNWLSKVSGSLDGIGREFFRHVGNDSIHCTPEKRRNEHLRKLSTIKENSP